MKRIVLSGFFITLFLMAGSVLGVDAKRDIVKMTGEVIVEKGTSVNNAVSIAGHLIVNGNVENDAVSAFGSIDLGPDSVVNGRVIVIGGKLTRDPASKIAGDIIEIAFPGVGSVRKMMTPNMIMGLFAGLSVVIFISFLAHVILTIAVLPGRVTAISSLIENNILNSFLWGVAGAILIVPATILLAVSIVGILLIPVGLLLVAFGLFLGYISTAHQLGKRIFAVFKKTVKSEIWTTFAGIFILFLTGFMPVVGTLIKLAVIFIGFGGVINSILKVKKSAA